MAEWRDPVPVASDLDGRRPHLGARAPLDAALPARHCGAVGDPVVEPDPVITEWDRLKREYLARLVVSRRRSRPFWRTAFAGRGVLHAADFEVTDAERALVFQRLRLLGLLGSPALARRYRVVVEPDRLVETDWSICPDFRVERVDLAMEGRAHAV